MNLATQAMFSTDYSWPRAGLAIPLPSSDDHFLMSVSLVLLHSFCFWHKVNESPSLYTMAMLWNCPPFPHSSYSLVPLLSYQPPLSKTSVVSSYVHVHIMLQVNELEV